MLKSKKFLVIMSILLFLVLVFAVEEELLNGFESWVYNESIKHMSNTVTAIVLAVTNIGGYVGITTCCVLIYLIPKIRKKVALPVSISVFSSYVGVLVLKKIFARNRPNILRIVSEDTYSFPSAHAMVNMALYSTLAIYAYKYIKDRKKRNATIVLLYFIPLLIGFTRIYLGVHYITDVVGGWLLGFAISVVVYAIDKKFKLQEDVDKIENKIEKDIESKKEKK